MEIDDHATSNLFSWEQQYQRSWDAIQEDENGSISTSIQKLALKNLYSRRIRSKLTSVSAQEISTDQAVKRGIIRHVFLVIDASKSSLEETDFHPSRFASIVNCIETVFIPKFFHQNCLGQVGIVAMRDGIGEKVCDLTSDPSLLLQSLKRLAKSLCNSEHSFSKDNFPSMLNGVKVASKILSLLSSKSCSFGEILLFYASIFTVDSGNLLHWASENLVTKTFPIKLSIISLGGSMQISTSLTKMTSGMHLVPINECHMKDFLTEYSIPLLDQFDRKVCSLLPVGFPIECTDSSLQCPKCLFPIKKEIPTECEICGLLLVSGNHLSRSFCNLFVVSDYEQLEVSPSNVSPALICFGCAEKIEIIEYRCKKCHSGFCMNCDEFIHDTLQMCPGCNY